MAMELSVRERLLLLDILPAQGDITTLLVIREAQEALGFQDEEREALEMVAEDGRVRWNMQIETPKIVRLGDAALAIIAGRLKELSERKQLGLEHVDLYRRFVSQDPST